MKYILQIALVVALMVSGVSYFSPEASTAHANHTFEVEDISVCPDNMSFIGYPTAASAVGVAFTVEIWDAGFFEALYTTDISVVFSSVGETVFFQVGLDPDEFRAGEVYGLSVTDIPGSVAGAEGWSGIFTVSGCEFSSNQGLLQIGAGANVVPTESPAGSPILLGNAPLVLPQDADGNGYDTFLINAIETIDGVVYYQIFLGGLNFGWVRANVGVVGTSNDF